MLVFDCSSCGAKLQMPEELAGKQVRCATCQGIITAPIDPSAAISAEPVPASRPAATGVTASENVPAPRPAVDAGDDRDDDLRRGTRRDGSTAIAASAGIGAGVIIAIVLGVGACLIIPCLIALLVPAVQKVREAAARTQTMNNMKQIGLAAHGHVDTFKTFPTPKALKPPQGIEPVDLSWRVSILPFIEQNNVFNAFDRTLPWDNPRNQQLLNPMPMQYNHVSRDTGPGSTMTVFQYFTGPGTLWPDNGPRTMGQITDGTSNTFLFAEAAVPVPWSKAADMAIQPGQPLPLPADHFLVGFADGSVRRVERSRAPDNVLRLYIDHKDGNVAPPID